MLINTEKVMAVKKEILVKNGFRDEKGFYIRNKRAIYNTALIDHVFLKRSECETDPTYKQIIPYVIVSYHNKYLLLKRLPAQGEKRLHGLYSIGVGGHIKENEDAGEKDIIVAGTLRELNEEVALSRVGAPGYIGFLNDNTNEVGSVHLGLVFMLGANDDYFKINEPDKMTGSWASLDELGLLADRAETWSRVMIDFLISVKNRS